jgi:hypothetical protein
VIITVAASAEAKENRAINRVMTRSIAIPLISSL